MASLAPRGDPQYAAALAEARRRCAYRWRDLPIDRMISDQDRSFTSRILGLSRPISQRDPRTLAVVELAGVRTLLDVPMLRENELIGVFIFPSTGSSVH